MLNSKALYEVWCLSYEGVRDEDHWKYGSELFCEHFPTRYIRSGLKSDKRKKNDPSKLLYKNEYGDLNRSRDDTAIMYLKICGRPGLVYRQYRPICG